ncbi:MAG TPA: SurA N-terminal domain-containing protein [Acidobacteriota bacterium]|nr:SurA N-terminal domain-containing protein [Acidobacteriota bacterium]
MTRPSLILSLIRGLPALLLLCLQLNAPALAQPPAPASGDSRLADRLAAVVEGEVITLTDVQWLILYKGFEPPQDPRQVQDFRLDILQQIIEEKLIANEARRTPGVNVTAVEVERQVEAYRQRFPDEEAFQRRLQEMDMDRTDLRNLIGRQLAVLRFLQLRFEPFIIVLPDEISDFYDNRLRPELEESGQPLPDLDLIREDIREILTVEKTNLEIERWVRERSQKSEVTILLGRQHPQFANLPAKVIEEGNIRPLGKNGPGGPP